MASATHLQAGSSGGPSPPSGGRGSLGSIRRGRGKKSSTGARYEPPAPSSLVPLVGRPRWKRSVRTTDVGPGDDDGRELPSPYSAADPRRRPFNPVVVRGGDDVGGGRRAPLIEEIRDEDKLGATDAAADGDAHEGGAGCASPPEDGGEEIICPTCGEHRARYRCPRCRAPYCSAACYRVHDVPRGSSAAAPDGGGGTDDAGAEALGGGGGVGGGGRCTESFYRG